MQEDFERRFCIEGQYYTLELGWSDHNQTLFARLSLLNTEEAVEFGLEPESYHRLDFLLRDICAYLEACGITELATVAQPLSEYLECGTVPSALAALLHRVEQR